MHLLFAVTDTWFNTFNMNFSCSVWKLKFNILLFLSYKRSQVLEEWLLLLQFPLWNTGKNIGVYGLGTKLVFACLNSVLVQSVWQGKWSGSQAEHGAGKLVLLVWVPAVFAHILSFSFAEGRQLLCPSWKVICESPFSEGRAVIFGVFFSWMKNSTGKNWGVWARMRILWVAVALLKRYLL